MIGRENFLDTYAPQVLIKTRITKPILRHNYSLQCNARGNPIPRLRWSKNNQILEYYSSARQCKTSSRIYSIQNKYKNPTSLSFPASRKTVFFSDINRSYIFNH